MTDRDQEELVEGEEPGWSVGLSRNWWPTDRGKAESNGVPAERPMDQGDRDEHGGSADRS